MLSTAPELTLLKSCVSLFPELLCSTVHHRGKKGPDTKAITATRMMTLEERHQHLSKGANLGFINRAQKGEEMVGRGIAHQYEVVGCVLVMAGRIQSHHALQKCL